MEMKRGLDSYEFYAFEDNGEEELIDEVRKMEENSKWIPGIRCRDLKVYAIDGAALFDAESTSKPTISTSVLASQKDADPELIEDTRSTNGMGLAINLGHQYALLRNTAYNGLCNAAKINGSALSNLLRKDAKVEDSIGGRVGFAEIINIATTVAKGSALALMRYGKLSALHSNADGGYEVMPISKLLEITADAIRSRFGTAKFVEGYNSHSYTSAVWTLPDAQSRLLQMYQDAIDKNGGSKYAVDFMPIVRFSSSDTSASCATLEPMFEVSRNETPIRFCDPVKIKHTKRSDKSKKIGLEAFQEQSQTIYAKFEESAKKIAELSSITVMNPCNCVVSLCNKYDIGKKYGEAARAEVEAISGGAYLSAHDVYLSMTEVVAEAIRLGASDETITRMEEAVAKVLHADWAEHDIGGTVPWKASNAA